MNQVNSVDQQAVINLLGKLGETRVDYPPEMLSTARTVFQRKVTVARAQMLQAQASVSHSPAAVQSGGSVIAWGSVVQFAVAVLLVCVLAMAAYLLRDEWRSLSVRDLSTTTYAAPVKETATPEASETALPAATPLPAVATTTTPVNKTASTRVAPTATSHPGKHLGQTPGTPQAPGQAKTPKP